MPVMKFDAKRFDELDNKTLHNIFLLRSEVFVVEQECAISRHRRKRHK